MESLFFIDVIILLMTPVWIYTVWAYLEGRGMHREAAHLRANTAEKYRLIAEMKAGRIHPDDAMARCRAMDSEPSLCR